MVETFHTSFLKYLKGSNLLKQLWPHQEIQHLQEYPKIHIIEGYDLKWNVGKKNGESN